ncbi:hypothetical protein, partial [Marinobacter sp.]|uniref:hypothetical protein n=1 Tax=Marinobacter sp. TaxID=50741 RepID=UPI00356ACAB3
LQRASQALGQAIEVRLHPNSNLGAEPWPPELKLAPADERLEDFAKRHGLLLCGNTQAQAKALADGTVVVHCEGLDPLPFDHHDYVRDGILPGCKKIAGISYQKIFDFYKSGDYEKALGRHMGPNPDQRKPGLSEFIALLLAAHG